MLDQSAVSFSVSGRRNAVDKIYGPGVDNSFSSELTKPLLWIFGDRSFDLAALTHNFLVSR